MQAHRYNQGNLPLSFEQALSRLEEIVQALETGQLSLDETVALYEEGQRLRAFCEQKLTEAQQRIKVVTGISEGVLDIDELLGTPQVMPVEAFQSTDNTQTDDYDIDLDVYDTDGVVDDPFR